MSLYDDIINKKKKEWSAENLMDGAKQSRGKKIPFSSPLMNWSTYGGIPRDKITEFFGEPGGGKAQPMYSKVLTPNGFVRMGDIHVGDTVIDGDGNECKVTAVYPQGVRPIYEITTTGKNKIRVADNHLNSVWWWNSTKQKREDFVWTTEELIKRFNQNKSWRPIRFDIPSVSFSSNPVPIDPYLIGVLIGDGSLKDNFQISNPEKDIVKKCNSILEAYDYELVNYVEDGISWTMRVIPDRYIPGRKTKLRNGIESLGLNCLSSEKYIPKCYLINDFEIRTKLLQGLFDTDGCINKDGSVEWTTVSPKLSEDFTFLVQSLGIRDTVTIGKAGYRDTEGKYIDCGISYQHWLKIENGFPFFSSIKHRSRYKNRQRLPMRNIRSIDYIGNEECQCIMVDSPLHTYISDDFIPTHNTTSAVDVCKNAYPIFKQEHEDRINYLRGVAKTGNKGAAAEMEELVENGPKKILYIDLEHSFDSQWASTIGIKPEEIEIMQPPDVVAEDILQTVQELICTGQVGLVVLDSIPSLVPRAELEKKYGERTVASLAGLLTIFFRKIVPILTRYGCTLIFINQIRQNMDNPYVVKTPGGEAPKFYASMRILFQIGNPVDFLGNELPKSSENPAGYIVNAKLVKQKSAPNDRKNASYFLMCQSGIREDMDFANLAMKKYGIIHKAAAWFSFADPYTGEAIEEDGKLVKVNGMAKVYEYLKSNKEYYAKLKKYIMDDIYGKSEDEINETSQESSEEL